MAYGISKETIDFIFDIKYKSRSDISVDTDDDWNSSDIGDSSSAQYETFQDKIEYLHTVTKEITVSPIYANEKYKEFIMPTKDSEDSSDTNNTNDTSNTNELEDSNNNDLFGEFNPDEVNKVDDNDNDTDTDTKNDDSDTKEQNKDINSGKTVDYDKSGIEEDKDIKEKISDNMKNNDNVSNDDQEENIKVIDGVQIKNGKIQWLLTTQNSKWKPIYNMKEEALNILFLDQGQLNYYSLVKELRDTSAKVKCVWDNQSTYEQMCYIQNHRDRIKQIQVECNHHLFFLDRFLDMLKGKVDEIQYNRPASKQEGLYHLHLRDLEIYLSWLKSIHKSSEMCVKTLDGAFETLSRQITIMMPQRDAANAMTRINEAAKKNIASEKQSDTNNNYDNLNSSLSSNGDKVIKTKKTGETISWNDI